MIKAEHKNPVYDAIKERGYVYLLMFREIEKRYSKEEAISVMRNVSRAQGISSGQSMGHLAPRNFKGMCQAWVMSPDEGKTFQPDVRKLDDTGLEVKMMSCPIKDAWTDAGCTDEEVCTLLYCASAYDEAAIETAGFNCEIELWSPGKSGCCLTRITEKT